jgi:hypothetical protein
MATTISEKFKSPPAKVRTEMIAALKERFPDFVHLLKWNPEGTQATGSKFGVKGSLELEGDGPTTLTVTYSIGFPASLKYSEKEAADALKAAFKELKARVA